MSKSNVYMRAATVLLTLLLALLLAACGGGDDNGTDAGVQPEETTVETGGSEEETEAPGGAGAQVAVTATEFEFVGLEDPMPAGETTFNFVNDGKQPHEFILVHLSDDAPALDKLLKMSEQESGKFFEEQPQSAFAKPGKSQEGAFTMDLASGGRYAYVCFVQDPKTEKPHALLGMVGEFSVE